MKRVKELEIVKTKATAILRRIITLQGELEKKKIFNISDPFMS